MSNNSRVTVQHLRDCIVAVAGTDVDIRTAHADAISTAQAARDQLLVDMAKRLAEADD